MLLVSLSVTLALLLAILALRSAESNRLVGCGVLLVTAGISFILFRIYVEEIYDGWMSAKADVVALVTHGTLAPQRPQHAWPPVVGKSYPDLQCVDQTGRRMSLSELKGKVILVEPVGMPCKACVALAGGHECGPLDGVEPQSDLKSIEAYAREYGGFELDDDRMAVVQILFYNQQMQSPTAEDARRWATHFGMDRAKNRVVLAADPYLLGQATRDMIPGFQIIDKDFILRYDSTGHKPKHDLYTELLPNVRGLLEE